MSKLLLVDDERSILKVLKWRLEMMGYQVDTALSANEALDKIISSPPDVLITDVRMPKMDGMTLIDTIKHNLHSFLPCIVMSGHGDIDVATEASNIGAIGFVYKPIKFDELAHLIKQALTQPAQSTKPSI